MGPHLHRTFVQVSLAYLRQAGTLIQSPLCTKTDKKEIATKYKEQKKYDSLRQWSDHTHTLWPRRLLQPAEKRVWPSPFTLLPSTTRLTFPPEQVPHCSLTEGSKPGDSSCPWSKLKRGPCSQICPGCSFEGHPQTEDIDKSMISPPVENFISYP